MRFTRSLLFLLCATLLFTACSKYSKIQKSKDVNYKLEKADEYFANKKYRQSQQLYEDLFPSYKGSAKFEELYYKWAYSYYYQGLYAEAQNYFKSFLETFPNSPKAEEVDYMRALSFYKQSPRIELEQTNTLKAINMMQTFINTHPGSTRIQEATHIIDLCREKLELKDYRAAELYYNLKQFRASALAFQDLATNYPESVKGEDYNLMVVKSYFKFAKLSIQDKQTERFGQVVQAYEDFVDRHPDSKLLPEAESYSNQSKTQIKTLQNEQITSAAKL